MSAGAQQPDAPDVAAEDITLDAEPPAQEPKRRTPRKATRAADS